MDIPTATVTQLAKAGVSGRKLLKENRELRQKMERLKNLDLELEEKRKR